MEQQATTGGWIEVICGGMFSGKTEELIRRVKRATLAKQGVQVFKPAIDNRYDEQAVVSHAGFSIEGVAVDRPGHMQYLLKEDTKVVGIDEVQFFSEEIVNTIEEMTKKGVRVICAGLDQDFTGAPFGIIGSLLAIADDVTKVHAICMQCGAEASKSKRIAGGDAQVEVGESDKYEARCRGCFLQD
ncbi:MAG: thymidine kinase [Candidatus Magasanikbacteria bacterium]|jgi:thymidine kinase|nr:thymidine kinase [Candidatus Magasanikbacteria bacterium]